MNIREDIEKTSSELRVIGGIFMKLRKYIRTISFFTFFLTLFTILNSIVSISAVSKIDIPDKLIIRVSRDRIYEVQYDNYTIGANKINAEGRNEVVYCLEIDQDYPSGELFERTDKLNEEVDGIITHGYPYVSYKELNVENETQAYFATQIAIWSVLENYDINKLKCDNTAILNAIKTIYAKGIEEEEVKYGNVEYISPNESVQRVVVVFEKVYPPQEG